MVYDDILSNVYILRLVSQEIMLEYLILNSQSQHSAVKYVFIMSAKL